LKYIPPNVSRVCSPFLGGGSIELKLASQGVEIYGYDCFTPLIEFWQELLYQPKQLARRVIRCLPLSRTRFYHLQESFFSIKRKNKRATVFYVLNRASFSGTTLAGGMSLIHPRFTKAAIKSLGNFKTKNFHVKEMDFRQSIPLHANDFLYLDPPYMINSKLYGVKGELQQAFDHNTLAQLLYKRSSWLLSYNDCSEVRRLYKNYRIIKVAWSYGMNGSKKSNEVLIMSNDMQIPKS
jgi:DNA adenine methylase